MKERLVLDKNALSYWLRQIRKGALLIAPVRSSKGEVLFESLEQIHEIVLQHPMPPPSLKEFIFPQIEFMFEYSRDNIRDIFDENRKVIIGARSCDIYAINIIDRFFSGETVSAYDMEHPKRRFSDPYYFSRRQNTIFISIGCNEPGPVCFCQSIGTGPFLERGFDIQLIDLEDRYLVEIGSERAEELINRQRYLFRKAEKNDLDDRYEALFLSISRFEKRVDLEDVRKSILEKRMSEDFWQWLAERCFECGGCVYVCPLCTCFNIIDHPVSDHNGTRFRIWDTCLFKGFTEMAGRIIPAEKKESRLKRWWFHKVLYYPEQFRSFGCVGCGRCTIACPGNIDIATVSEKIKRWR